MPRMPGAIWRPLADNYASMPRIKAWDLFVVHTMVGTLAGTDAYFRAGGYTGTESHFGVGHDGTIYQWQDTDFQADANYRGGWHIISSENADTGTGFPKWSGSDVPAFTDAQIEANAKIAAWLNKTHGIPVDVIPDAKVGRRGIGWHRQGVPGYMAAGAELWSTAPGKVCPGDRRVSQVPRISARAKQLLTGDDDMSAADVSAINAFTDRRVDELASFLRGSIRAETAAVQRETLAAVGSLAGQVAGLAQAVAQIEGGGGLDSAAIERAATTGANAALAELGQKLAAADDA